MSSDAESGRRRKRTQKAGRRKRDSPAYLGLRGGQEYRKAGLSRLLPKFES
jgi:hypothetical protein